MERYTFDQNVTQYFEWLRKEHCKITKNDALFRYLHKRAIGVLWKMLEKEYIDNWYTCFAASAVLISIPIAILFLRMQKYYVNGLSGGVKG